MGEHLRLPGQSHLSRVLGRLDPYEGHLRLTGQSHLSRVLGRLDTYGGTFGIDWSISFVPATFEEAGPL